MDSERLRCCAPRWLNPEFLLPFRSGGATAGHSPIPFAFACARPDVRTAEVVPAGETVGAAGTGAAAADTPLSAAVGRAPGHSWAEVPAAAAVTTVRSCNPDPPAAAAAAGGS